jgi:hypothetical protein
MNELKQYIKKHKDLFEEEPPKGHFERLQQRMNHQSRRTVALRWSISVAASVAIAFLTYTVWQNTGKQDNRTILCENTIDMKACYLNKMNIVAGHIQMLTENLDPWTRQQVMSDVQNIIDTADSGFENEIPEELPNDKAKSILSDYYRYNLECLEMIAKEL